MTKKYKTLDNAKAGFKRIINTWETWLDMGNKLWIVKWEGNYYLQDYSPIMTSAFPEQVNLKERIIDMDAIKVLKAV